jgi:hypothetical protein
MVDVTEDCDGDVGAATCESLGYEAGTLACGADCLYDLGDCSLCGDGIQAGPEDCDGIDFGGETCVTQGFGGGNLGCALATCTFVYTGCTGGMYVQDFEGVGGVMPPELAVDPGTPWFVDDMNPVNGLWSARSGAFPVGVGGITDLTLDADFPAVGDVSFLHEESTAAGIDFLEFYVDGVLQQSWSGTNASATHAQPVPAGMHTFRWRFNRSGFVDAGLNAVFVDDIVLSGGVPL